MKHEVEAEWKGKMRFDSRIGDHIVAMDVPVHSGVIIADHLQNLSYWHRLPAAPGLMLWPSLQSRDVSRNHSG